MVSEEGQEDLFQIKLNERGRHTILKTARFVGITMGIAIFNNLTNLLLVAFRSYKFNFSESKTNSLYRWFLLADILILISLVLNLIGIFKYYSFVNSLKKSIITLDEERFNRSFRFLYSNIIFWLAVLVLNLVTTVIYFFGASNSL